MACIVNCLYLVGKMQLQRQPRGGLGLERFVLCKNEKEDTATGIG